MLGDFLIFFFNSAFDYTNEESVVNKSYVEKGDDSYEDENYILALDRYFEALANNPSRHKKGVIYSKIASSNNALGNHKKAIEFAQKSISLLTESELQDEHYSPNYELLLGKIMIEEDSLKWLPIIKEVEFLYSKTVPNTLKDSIALNHIMTLFYGYV